MPPDGDKTASDSDLDSIYSFSNQCSKIPIVQRRVSASKQKYVCSFDDCKETFLRSTLLDRHEFKHNGIKKHVCFYENCSKSYTISTHLKRHIQSFHEKNTKPKTIKCILETCNKFFDSPFNMERHMKEVHENCKIYTCKTCTKDFNRKIQLRRHEVTHTGEYPYNCRVCSKGFVQQIHFDRHTCNVHICQECKQVFLKWSLLVAHKKSEHPKNYVCEVCKKVFKRKQYLKDHKQLHKEKLDREVFPCQFEGCARFYYCVANLKAHIKVNHEGLRFECPIAECKIKLVSKQKLNEHIAKIHSDNKQNKISKKLVKGQKKIRSDYGKKKFSMATKLSCLVTTPEVEKIILSGKGAEIKLDDIKDNLINNELKDNDNLTCPVQLSVI